ncbi:MAG TPA: hypothetical protein VGO52_09275 [Hyphomonadaceae bacterium]|nr:hypothetical protein [Hyphomonadaceae bacterium]
MKNAIAAIASGCAILVASPAFADASAISLSKGVKLCKTEFARLQPALKSYIADLDDSTSTSEQFAIQFKVTDAEGRLDKFICTVDRKAQTAGVAQKKRRASDFSPPEYAGPKNTGIEKMARAD